MSRGQIRGAVIVLLIAVFMYIVKAGFHCWHNEAPSIPCLGNRGDSLVVKLEGSGTNNGIYFLPQEVTVHDLLTIAGVEDLRDFDEKDLAVIVGNGRKVIINSKDGFRPYIELGEIDGATKFVLGMPMDINRATAGDLELIPGIGKRTAQAIIEHREKTGKFTTMDDLNMINSLGVKKFGEAKKYFYIGGA